jgi:cbb3-type cytochrome oxidase subunit 3
MSLIELLPGIKSLWTVWFFLVFVAVVAWTLWPGRRNEIEARGRIPLDDDLPAGDDRHGN